MVKSFMELYSQLKGLMVAMAVRPRLSLELEG
jgi:hypothetical protein